MTRPFENIYQQTLEHLHHHDCGTYPFSDGAALIKRVAMLRPRRILELGTALGYTSCCFANAAPNALIDTVERDEGHVVLARANFKDAGIADRVTVHHGSFEDVLPNLKHTYDIAFFDGFAPDLAIVVALKSLLSSTGTLICANLGLAKSAAQHALKTELSNSEQWQILPALEQGGTLVATKHLNNFSSTKEF